MKEFNDKEFATACNLIVETITMNSIRPALAFQVMTTLICEIMVNVDDKDFGVVLQEMDKLHKTIRKKSCSS